MKNAILQPQVSVGEIRLGDNIENYANHQFEYSDKAGESLYRCYSFKDIPILAYVTETGKIESIRCAEQCIWQGINLIGLDYNEFKNLYSKVPDEVDRLFVTTNGEEQEQDVYDYDDLGLQVWILEEKIVTVIAMIYDE